MTNLFDIRLVFTQIPELLRYLPVTLELTIAAGVGGIILGLLIAIIRMRKVPVLSQLSVGFVSIVRGTPIIVQLYLIYFAIPIAMKYYNFYHGTNYTINGIPEIVFAIIALGLNQSAFDSETIRSALQSVDKGQVEAATSLGMSKLQILYRIIIPEAFSVALLPLGNSLINLIKGTSLAFNCSVVEMTAQGKIIAGRNYRYFEVYCSLAIIYWVITFVLERVIKYLEAKVTVPESVPAYNEPSESRKKVPGFPIWEGVVGFLSSKKRMGVS